MLPALNTKDLTIRPFGLSDSNRIYQLSREKTLAKWIPDQVYKDEKEAAEVLEYLINEYRAVPELEKHPLVLAIVLTKEDLVIGHVGLSPYKSAVEIGYAIAEDHFGKGYATQAVSAVSVWAIENSWARKIYGVVASENVGSVRVLEKSSYKFEDEVIQKYHGQNLLCRRYCYE